MSYRTPAEVLAVASRVLAVAAPELTPPKAVRRTGVEPRMLQVTGDVGPATSGDLARAVARAAAEEVDAVRPGRVAIIAPDALHAVLSDALYDAGVPVVDARDMRGAVCPSRWCCSVPTRRTGSNSTRSWWSSPQSSPARRPGGRAPSTSP